MSEQNSSKTAFVDQSKIGEYAAQQPLSGVIYVGGADRAVNGMATGNYVHVETSEEKPAA